MDTDIASPGTTLYYGLRTIQPALRGSVVGLFALYNTLRGVVLSDSEVSVVKLAWWQEEIDRMLCGRPRHPVSKSIAVGDIELPVCLRSWVPGLQPFLTGSTFHVDTELMDFGRALSLPLFMACSSITDNPHESEDPDAMISSIAISHALFDFIQNLRDYLAGGILPVPQSDIDSTQLVSPDLFRSLDRTVRTQALERQYDRSIRSFNTLLSKPGSLQWARTSVGMTICAIQMKTLQEIKNSGYDTVNRHIDVTPLRKAWISWRVIRKHGE